MKNVADAKKLVQKYGVSIFVLYSCPPLLYLFLPLQTHIYRWANFGGKLEQVTSISDSIFKEHSEKAVKTKIESSLETSVSGNAEVYSGSFSASASYGNEGERETVEDETVESHTTTSSMRAYGGGPFDGSQSSFEDWAQSIGFFL